MNMKREKQLNFLLPITNKNVKAGEYKAGASQSLNDKIDDEKRYIKIKESLRSKGLFKSR